MHHYHGVSVCPIYRDCNGWPMYTIKDSVFNKLYHQIDLKFTTSLVLFTKKESDDI